VLHRPLRAVIGRFAVERRRFGLFRENPRRRLVSNLHSILILGPDAVAAASPSSAVQLVHACHRWGFSTVIPASWGDELLAGEVIKRCSTRENRPAIQCSCPRVADRLGANAAKLDDSVFWLATPPVAAAQYVRAHANGTDVHITYAGACPGAIDASIDERMTPTELLMAISSRGIDIAAQPTVFENIIPPDRRRHFSTAAGMPDAQRLWEASAFRVSQPSDIDLSIGVAQLLLSEERLLIDMTGQVGCVCRTDPVATDASAILRAPSPVVRDGLVDVARSAPVVVEHVPEARRPLVDVQPSEEPPSRPAAESARPTAPVPRRNSPPRPAIRRQSAWRRQSPIGGVAIATAAAVTVTVPETGAFLKRTDVRVAIATAVAVASLMLGIWIGRQQSPSPGVSGAIHTQGPLRSP
jgi:hypothetical protein